MLEYLLIGLGLGFPASAQPGPFQAYLLTQTLNNGWRQTLPAAFAPLLSDGPIILLVMLVLTRLPDGVLVGLQVAGGLFLLYLAWRAWLSFRHYRPITAHTTTDRQSLREAALLNFLSPNPYIFWSTIAGPLLLTAWAQSPWYSIAFLIGFYGTLIGGFVAFVLLFGYVGGLSDRLGRILAALSAIALALFGAYQITIAVQTVLNT
jgi:threonine/homoserine/homoserine lactone efflux protein